jgi:predicted O-methyltransferase YrrM
MSDLPHSPAAERNRQPILQTLLDVLPARGSALEIASGTGQHAVWFAAGLPGWTWQPTEADPAMLPVIAAQAQRSGVSNVRPPRRLDVLASQWPGDGEAFSETFDAVYCANLLHIAPWSTCAALMRGAARYLVPSGVLVTYGPYLVDGVTTAPSNLEFDQSLRERNPQWGLRRLEDVVVEAGRAGLQLLQRHDMPANNLLLVFGF